MNKWKINVDVNIDFCIDDDKKLLDMQTFLKSGCLCDLLSQDEINLLRKLINEGVDLNLSLIMAVYYCHYPAGRYLLNNGAEMYDTHDKKILQFTDMINVSPIALIKAALNTIKLNNGMASLHYSA